MTKRRPLLRIRGTAALARLAPLARGLGRQPWVRAAAAAWTRLLDEACDLMAPAFARFGQDARLVAVPRAAGGLELFHVKGGVATRLDAPPTDAKARHHVELRLRADQMLERRVVLPAPSRDYLDAIIDHRLERLVPWRRDTILHGFEIEGGDGGGLTVRVVLTSSDIVAGPVSDLQAMGLAASRIGGEADRPAEPLRLVFGRGATAHRPKWQGTFGRLWLTGTGVCCALAVVATLIASGATARRDEAERHLVKARRLIREATDAASPDTQPLLVDKKRDLSTMVLIDRLAAALPDTSYLRELAMTPADVRLIGTATDAPALIPLIEKAGFYNVRFSGPVSRGDDKRDAFEITADRAPKKDAP